MRKLRNHSYILSTNSGDILSRGRESVSLYSFDAVAVDAQITKMMHGSKSAVLFALLRNVWAEQNGSNFDVLKYVDPLIGTANGGL